MHKSRATTWSRVNGLPEAITISVRAGRVLGLEIEVELLDLAAVKTTGSSASFPLGLTLCAMRQWLRA